MVLAYAERVGWRRVFVFEGLLPRRMAAAAGPLLFASGARLGATAGAPRLRVYGSACRDSGGHYDTGDA